MNVETKANVGDTIYFLKRINRVPYVMEMAKLFLRQR